MTAATRPLTRFVPMTAVTALLALSLLATGCNDEKKLTPPPPPSDYLPQSSADNVLVNLQTAYGKRSIEEYRKLFSEDFTFVFNPLDASDPDNPTPMQWGLADEWRSTANLFTSTLVDRIELTSYVLGAPDRVDSLTFGPRAWKARVDAVNLLVATGNESGDPLIYMVVGTTEMFYFREKPTRPASDGRPTWFIFRWEDQPIHGVKTERTSWGQIKVLYW